MPYINAGAKNRLDIEGEVAETAGELTYQMTQVILGPSDQVAERRELRSLVSTYIQTRGERFATFAEILGALAATELEYYRRTKHQEFQRRLFTIEVVRADFYNTIVAPYEDRKIAENGDVYYTCS